jgi:hypothetical protein
MPLPTPDQLIELQRRLNLSGSGSAKKYGTVDKVQNALRNQLKEAMIYGAGATVRATVTHVSGAAAFSAGAAGVSVALFPIGAALGPWIGAARIAGKADGIFSLHDLKKYANGEKGSYYPCSCGKCAEGLQYVINKKEYKIAIAATSIFLAGIPFAATKVNSVRKRSQKGRPKERYSQQFVSSAQEGCLNALATIMLLCGKWPQNKAVDPSQYIDPITCILAENGWQLLKSKW